MRRASSPPRRKRRSSSTRRVWRQALKVSFTMAGKTATCEPGFTVLQAARSVGVRIGAACESGLCGTCMVMKISGEVEMNHNGGILDDEIEEGYILACCSRPKGMWKSKSRSFPGKVGTGFPSGNV